MRNGRAAWVATSVFAVAWAGGVACSSGGSDPQAENHTGVCTPNAPQACQCPTGQPGTQQCAPDGSAWLDCVCDGGIGGTGGGTVGAGGGATTTCTPSYTQGCTCPDGVASFQTCDATGVWGECQCAGPAGFGGAPTGAGGAPAGLGGAVTGLGGAVTGLGGAVTGLGGAVTGLGGAVTGAGGDATGLGGAATGVGGDATGLGGAATGVGGDATGLGGAATGVGGDATGLGGDTGTGGSAGAEVVQKDCAVMTTLTSPVFTDFESYDGATDAGEWSFPFNGTAEDSTAVYAGPYGFDDASGTPFFGMVAGNASNYALSASNTAATEWGVGFGLWMGCIDASAYTGIQFHIRGTAAGGVGVSLSMEDTTLPDAADPAGGGTCAGATEEDCVGASYTIESTSLTDTFTLIQIPWTAFTDGDAAGVAVPATGSEITGINFSANLAWEEDPENAGTWIPVPGAVEVTIDDISFY